MKKFLTILSAVILLISAASCAIQQNPASPTEPTATPSATPVPAPRPFLSPDSYEASSYMNLKRTTIFIPTA